jgi:cystathionine beta-lyase family protein involved in aluminum resistance
MHEITNPKIEKQKVEIERTKAKVAEFVAKQREQEKQLRALEDMEIVARFRSERISDEHLQAAKGADWEGIPKNNNEEVKKSGTITEN